MGEPNPLLEIAEGGSLGTFQLVTINLQDVATLDDSKADEIVANIKKAIEENSDGKAILSIITQIVSTGLKLI